MLSVRLYQRYSEESLTKAEQMYAGAYWHGLQYKCMFECTSTPTHGSSLRLLRSSKPVRGTSDVPAFAVKRGDKNYVGPGSAKDLAER